MRNFTLNIDTRSVSPWKAEIYVGGDDMIRTYAISKEEAADGVIRQLKAFGIWKEM